MPFKAPKQLLDKLKHRNKDRPGDGHSRAARGKKSLDPARDAFYENMGKTGKPSTWHLPPQ